MAPTETSWEYQDTACDELSSKTCWDARCVQGLEGAKLVQALAPVMVNSER